MQPPQQQPNNVGLLEQEPIEPDTMRPMNKMNWVLAAIALVLFIAVIFFGTQQTSQPTFVPAPSPSPGTTAQPILGGGGSSGGASASTTTFSGGFSSGGVVPAAGSTNGTATGSTNTGISRTGSVSTTGGSISGNSATNSSTTSSSSSSAASGVPAMLPFPTPPRVPTSQSLTGRSTPGAANTP